METWRGSMGEIVLTEDGNGSTNDNDGDQAARRERGV